MFYQNSNFLTFDTVFMSDTVPRNVGHKCPTPHKDPSEGREIHVLKMNILIVTSIYKCYFFLANDWTLIIPNILMPLLISAAIMKLE